MKLTVTEIWLNLWRPRVVAHWLWHFGTWVLICLSGHSWNYFSCSICNISKIIDYFLLNRIPCHRHSSPTPVVNNICYLHRRSFAFCAALFFPLHSPGQYLNMTWNLFPRSFLSCFQEDISLTSLKIVNHFRISFLLWIIIYDSSSWNQSISGNA